MNLACVSDPSEEEVVVGLLGDPVRRGRDAVVDAGLPRLPAGEPRRHQAYQHPPPVRLLDLRCREIIQVVLGTYGMETKKAVQICRKI